MISFCTLCLNAKHEFHTFVEALAYNNRHINFEVCVCHDDRASDGSKEYLEQIALEYPFVKIIRNTDIQTISYLTKLIEWYRVKSIFPEDFREHLAVNLKKYSAGHIPNLWTGLGYLYNKAASIASGDILMFAPGDYIWPMDMNLLEAYVISNRIDGLFYGKFSGLMLPISNEPYDIIKQNYYKNGHLADTGIMRQRSLYPCRLHAHYLLDQEKVYEIADINYRINMINICKRLRGTHLFADMHHGTHIMTRQVYNIIGGFTEEFYGRAWPDDKMNAHAMRLFWKDSSSMPIDFSFNFIKTMHWNPCYLHDNYRDLNYTRNINTELDKEFASYSLRGRESPIVRLS